MPRKFISRISYLLILSLLSNSLIKISFDSWINIPLRLKLRYYKAFLYFCELIFPEEDKVNNVTYDVTTDSIFLNWVSSPYAQICKIKYRITVNVTNSIENIPYFRMEPNTKHIVRYLSSCTYYNVTIQASGLRKRDEKDRDPLMYVINTRKYFPGVFSSKRRFAHSRLSIYFSFQYPSAWPT